MGCAINTHGDAFLSFAMLNSSSTEEISLDGNGPEMNDIAVNNGQYL